MIVTPVHIGSIDGHPIRFFAAPSGRLEIPWECLDDLFPALGLPSMAVPRSVVVETRDGPAVIARYALDVRTALEGIIPEKEAADLHFAFLWARVEALEKVIGDLPHDKKMARIDLCQRNTVEAITGRASH